MQDARVDVWEVMLAQVHRRAHDIAAVLVTRQRPVRGILAIRPWVCRRLKHRPTLALAFFGSSAHEPSNCADVSRARMSRLVNPCRQCSPAIKLLNSVASGCANGLNPGQERPAASFFAVVSNANVTGHAAPGVCQQGRPSAVLHGRPLLGKLPSTGAA